MTEHERQKLDREVGYLTSKPTESKSDTCPMVMNFHSCFGKCLKVLLKVVKGSG